MHSPHIWNKNRLESTRPFLSKRRKAILTSIIVLMLLSIPTLHTRSEFILTPTNLEVSTDSQSMSAGMINNVRFTISNLGETAAERLFVTINLPSSQTGSALMILRNSDGKHFIDLLKHDQDYIIDEQIYVSPLAAGNMYLLTLTMTYVSEGTARTESRNLGISIPLLSSSGGVIKAHVLPYRLSIGENRLTLFLENVGDMDVYTVSASITMPGASAGSSPLSIINSDGKYIFDRIGVNESVQISLTIYASSASLGQVYQASLALTYTDNLKAKVDNKFLTLEVPLTFSPSANIDVATSKSELRSGEVNDLTLSVKNNGDGSADALTVQLALPSTQTLILMGSDGIWSVGRLEPGQEFTAPLRVFAGPAASGTTTVLTVTSTYSDMGYKTKQQVNSLGMIVRGSVNLTILGTSTFPTSITSGTPFSLTVNFINQGTATAQSVIFIPGTTSNLQPLSKDKIFLGDLGVNIPSSLTISYRAINVTSGNQNMALDYSFKDSLGSSFSGSLNVTFPLAVIARNTTGSGTSQPEQRDIPPLLPFVVAGAIVIAGVAIFYRRRKG